VKPDTITDRSPDRQHGPHLGWHGARDAGAAALLRRCPARGRPRTSLDWAVLVLTDQTQVVGQVIGMAIRRFQVRTHSART